MAALVAQIAVTGTDANDHPKGRVEDSPQQQSLDLTRFLRRMLGSDDLAEAIAALTYAQLSDIGVPAWPGNRALLFDVATGLALSYLRKRASSREVDQGGKSHVAPDAVPRKALEARQRQLAQESKQVSRVIDEMPPDLRRVVTMRYVSHIPTWKIASDLNTSVAEIEKRLNKALTYCRTRLPDPK